VVTHAHHDHGGWVPVVVRRFPSVPVIATEATGELLRTMWRDAASVMAQRASESPQEAAAYDLGDVRRAAAAIVPVPFGRVHTIGDLSVELFPAGHILGAAGVVVHAGGRRVVVSGDVSGPGQRSVGGVELPPSAVEADLMLLESTYAGHGRRAPRATTVSRLVADIREVLDRGGRVLIPAFALGRAQEAAMTVAAHLPEADVVVDGLARDVSEVYGGYSGPDGRPLSVLSGRVRPVPRGRTAAEIRRLRSGVVVSTSGMLASGPALAWAAELLGDERSAVFLVGYQGEGSPGRRLLETAEAGGQRFLLPSPGGRDVEVPLHCLVATHQLGAHASPDELVELAAQARPKQLMLVHGVRRDQLAFERRLALRRQATTSNEQVWTIK
jgi:Cft2 family RNA processing exonuclease